MTSTAEKPSVVGRKPADPAFKKKSPLTRIFASRETSAADPGHPSADDHCAGRAINSQAGDGFELQAVGAAVIGGVAITGGTGTVIGAALGAFLLVTINRALPVLGIPDFWQKAVVGALILGAIVLGPAQ